MVSENGNTVFTCFDSHFTAVRVRVTIRVRIRVSIRARARVSLRVMVKCFLGGRTFALSCKL